jgi:thioredoxin 1
MSTVIKIESFDELNDTIQDNEFVVIDFSATWCGPCEKIKPYFESLAEKHKDCVFCSVDIEDCPDIADEYGIDKLPTFLIYKNKENCDEYVGGSESKMKEIIEKILP